jgi:hypothetical protein
MVGNGQSARMSTTKWRADVSGFRLPADSYVDREKNALNRTIRSTEVKVTSPRRTRGWDREVWKRYSQGLHEMYLLRKKAKHRFRPGGGILHCIVSTTTNYKVLQAFASVLDFFCG